jgi:hypothetical protein
MRVADKISGCNVDSQRPVVVNASGDAAELSIDKEQRLQTASGSPRSHDGCRIRKSEVDDALKDLLWQSWN